MRAVLSLVSLLALSFPTFTSAHVAMQWPNPRGSPEAAAANGYSPNYSIKDPGQGCAPFGKPSATNTFAAGSTILVKMRKDGASHNGGVCQWMVNDQVVQTDTDCPAPDNGPPKDWSVKIPANVKVGTGTFTWTWKAKSNGEFYKNCADVIITAAGSGSSSGDSTPPPATKPSNPPVNPHPPANNNPSTCPSSGGSSSSSSGEDHSGCGAGKCKSKWGFCGTGPEYCGSEEAAVDDALEGEDEESESQEDAQDSPVVESEREWAPHYSDEWLLARKVALEEEMMQLMEEVGRRVNYDDKREEEEKHRAEARENHKKRHARKHHRREH